MNLIRSFLKSRKLAKLSGVLGGERSLAGGMEAFLEAGKIQDEAFEQLLDLVEAQPDLRVVTGHYAASRDTLRNLYARLRASGAGQWERGHYVAASSLVFATTLDYLLRTQNATDFRGVAFRFIDYFGRGELGEIAE